MIDLEIHLYDAEPEPGGVIKTEEIDGCIVEAGPDSFLTQKQNAAELCRDLGLGDALIGSITILTLEISTKKCRRFVSFTLGKPTGLLPCIPVASLSSTLRFSGYQACWAKCSPQWRNGDRMHKIADSRLRMHSEFSLRVLFIPY